MNTAALNLVVNLQTTVMSILPSQQVPPPTSPPLTPARPDPTGVAPDVRTTMDNVVATVFYVLASAGLILFGYYALKMIPRKSRGDAVVGFLISTVAISVITGVGLWSGIIQRTLNDILPG